MSYDKEDFPTSETVFSVPTAGNDVGFETTSKRHENGNQSAENKQFGSSSLRKDGFFVYYARSKLF